MMGGNLRDIMQVEDNFVVYKFGDSGMGDGRLIRCEYIIKNGGF